MAMRLCAILMLYAAICFAQSSYDWTNSPDKIDPIIKCNISVKPKSIDYIYIVNNGSKAQQPLKSLLIYVENKNELDMISVSEKDKKDVYWKLASGLHNKEATKIIHLSLSDYKYSLKKNSKSPESQINTTSLPTIVDFKAFGLIPTPTIEDGMELEKKGLQVPKEHFRNLEGKIIAPGFLPKKGDNPAIFLNQLKAQTTEAIQLGWVIDNKGTDLLSAIETQLSEYTAKKTYNPKPLRELFDKNKGSMTNNFDQLIKAYLDYMDLVK